MQKLSFTSITNDLNDRHVVENQLVEEVLDQRARVAESKVTDDLLMGLADQVVESERTLIELNDLKNRFLGMAAHDLRSPLSTILGMSELLISEELDAETTTEFHQTIHSVSEQMLALIEDLLDVSVIESGKFSLEFVEVDLVDLIERTVHQVSVLADRKSISLVMNLVPAVVECDAKRIAQVIDNLISNAIKFSLPDTRTTIRLTALAESVLIEVEDQGQGIPETELDQLFGAFHKLSVRPTGDERSTGLGLSIVKKIVQAHHGNIDVSSRQGEGSCFSVELPYHQDD